MSPTVFTHGSYRFFFFSREEPRVHIHVSSPEGEAKFWLEPIVALASAHGLNTRQLGHLQKLVEQHEKEIRAAWFTHFKA